MMKKILTKSFLMAVMLVGETNFAWAVTKTLYPTGTTDPTNTTLWTGSGDITKASRDGYISFTHAKTGVRNIYLKFYETGSDFYSDYSSYTVSFDFWNNNAWTNSSSSKAGLDFFAEGATLPANTNLLTEKNTSKNNYLLDLAGSGTWVNTFFANESVENPVTFTKQTWYTAKITVTSSGSVTWSICPQGSSTPITNGSGIYAATTDGTSFKCQGIFIAMGRGCYETRVANVVVTTEVDEEVVSDPNIAITEVSGANRTVTITGGTSTDGTATVTTYYTTDGSIPTSSSSVYSSALSITENCTVKAISISDKGAESGISSLAVTTGTVTLNAPTYTKTAYSAGVSTITLSCNQSDKILSPISTIHWSTGASSGDVVSGTSVSVNDGETLEAYCVAAGYTNSSTLSVTATPYVGASVWTESYTGTDGGQITLGDEIETGLYKMLASNGTITVSDYLLTANSNINAYFLLRNATCPGIYSGNGRTYAIAGLTAGQHLVVTTNNGSETATVTAGANLTKDTWETWPAHFAFDVTADGTVKFAINRYCSVTSVTVYSSTVSKTITSAGWATYCSPYALDFSDVIENLEAAYIVTGGEDGVLNKTEVTGTVPANTGLLLKGEGVVTIPVVASSSTDVSANKLVGVTSNTVIAAEAGYVLMGSPTLGFYLNNKAFTVGANTAYLPASFAAARAFYLFGDEMTGIRLTENSELRTESAVYDLQGRKVNSQFTIHNSQLKKGLYIVNGKKVVIK